MAFPLALKNAAFRLLRAGFRLAPLSDAVRDGLRQRFLDRHSNWAPPPPRSEMIVGAGGRRAYSHAGQPAVGHVPWRPGELPQPLPATLVAFYLPQFHPSPENDAWWGEGFTEWRNVARALPQFEGHVQPRLPGELGFYDLRLPEVMRRQMQLAREYGIGAFCMYFYWFAGKTLLEKPLLQWLSTPELDLPICLCWANENWSRRWDGRADEVLISQQHSAEDDLAFIAHIAPYLRDPRYLRVNGRPVLLVYRPGLLPLPNATTERWRKWCKERDVGELHLAYVQSFDRADPRDLGFDAAIEFPPNNTALPSVTERQHLLNPDFKGEILDWRELAAAAVLRPDPPYLLYPGVTPSWDNEPRRSGRGRVLAYASPRGYRDWLRHAIATARRRSPTAPLVFINAWNEWAEGAVLEPDARLGHAWLEATRGALTQYLPPKATVQPTHAVLHMWYPEILDETIAALHASGVNWRIIITTAPEREQAIRQRVTALGLDARIEVFENRGRDILPFLHVADRLLDEGADVVLKLHSKRSTHRRDGEVWRRELFGKLLAPERALRAVSAFEADTQLGLLAAEGHIQPLDYYWGANEANVRYLCRRLGIRDPLIQHDRFIAGSMFWVRLRALRPLLDANLGPWEFESESGQVDGTLAHAVERVIGLAADAAGYRMISFAELEGHPEPTNPYSFARKS